MDTRRVFLAPETNLTARNRLLAPFFPRYKVLVQLEKYPLALRGPLRNFILSHDHKLLFMRNLKCACTSITQLLYYYAIGDFYPRTIHRARKGIYLSRYYWDEIEPVWQAHSAFQFTFTRHPEPRAYSAFTNFFVDHKNLARHKHMQPMKDHGYDPARDAAYNFEVFIDYAAHQMQIDPVRADAHWRRQVLNIAYDAVTYDFIGKVENLNADIQEVFARAGIEGFPPADVLEARFNRSAAGKPPLTDSQRRKIRDLYAPDYEAFGY